MHLFDEDGEECFEENIECSVCGATASFVEPEWVSGIKMSMGQRAFVCPQCLEEAEYAEWELSEGDVGDSND